MITPKDMVVVSVDLFFNPLAVDCAHCPLLETYSRKQCRYTGEYIVNEKTLGVYCPVKLSEEQLDKIWEVKNEYVQDANGKRN